MVRCDICDKYIVNELTKDIQGFTVCANCLLQMVLDKKKRLNYRVGGEWNEFDDSICSECGRET
jgi:hypothetical protein